MRAGALWFSIEGAAGGSVFAVIFVGVLVGAVEIFEESIVYGRLADDIFLARPVAEVEELAAFAAEWKFRDGGGVRRFLADGAAEFHAVKNTAKRNRCGVRVFFRTEAPGLYFRSLPPDNRSKARLLPERIVQKCEK